MTPEPPNSTSGISESLPDRLRLDRQYDVGRTRKDVQTVVSNLVQQFYVYYSVVPLVGEVECPADHDWAAEPLLDGCDYLQQIFSEFETEITSIRLMRLEPGGVVKEHCDPTLDAAHREVVRLTLPVFTDDSVSFILDGTEVPLKPGELWYLKLSERHSVHNNGPNERINMSIDVTWNHWLENWLESHLI